MKLSTTSSITNRVELTDIEIARLIADYINANDYLHVEGAVNKDITADDIRFEYSQGHLSGMRVERTCVVDK